MRKLRVDTFLSGSADQETRQYHVLEGLKSHYDEFSHNRVYPSLAELVDLYAALKNILNGMSDIQGRLPHDIKEVDLEEGKLVYETRGISDDDLTHAAELITWALPQIKQAIEEGVSIYTFVDEHIQIEQVGILPMYREEGYWFVPENRAALLHLLRYEMSLFTAANERFRSLKTTNIGEVEQKLIVQSPESIKLRLIAQYRDLPNPATFMCETDLDFPYAETILPIAKRKLMAQVFS
ncbi:MAG: hypothetical protein HY961_10610 [Ignavibacteriae bacterium]|nr:hypothetical protein [Ignavibacteriota bacterium]